MAHVAIYLKGWRDQTLFTDAVNDDDHPLHAEAYADWLQGWKPYAPGQTVYLAFKYHEADADPRVILNAAFERFNVGTDDIARRYREGGNRSLSVGDLVVIDGEAWACASAGWDQVPAPAPAPPVSV